MEKKAYVFQMGERYFYKYAKGRVLSAWSLAGARMFAEWDNEGRREIMEVFKEKGIDYKILEIGVLKIVG